MPEHSAPRFLFVPASGPGGAGEYMRCRILAAAVERRWPRAQIHFIVSRHASYARDVPYRARLLDASPAHATAEVTEYIESVRPDVVIFDSTGRAAQLAAAKAAGAACVFISARPNARRKGLRWNRMRWLDQHWVAQPPWATPPPTLWERLKKRWWSRLETLHFAALFEESEPGRREQLRRELGITERPYLAFCAGGGGDFKRRPRAAEVLLAAAVAVSGKTSATCVVVLGPNYDRATERTDGVIAVSKLDNARLMDLLHDAELVVTGGGGVLLQALAQRKLCIAVPVAGDQPERIRRCVERGLVEAAALSADDIMRAVTTLLTDVQRRSALMHNLRDMPLRNGVPDAVTALERLLDHGWRSDRASSAPRR